MPGGAFCNLEPVASASEALHHECLARLGTTAQEKDPSNTLLQVDTQLSWLREIGCVDVDCHWTWRELALLAGTKPCGAARQRLSCRAFEREGQACDHEGDGIGLDSQNLIRPSL